MEELKNPHLLLREFVVANNSWGGWLDDVVCQEMILAFLDEENFSKKADYAIVAIKEVIKHSQKHEIPDTLADVYKVEKSTFGLFTGSRDHVVHSLNTYLLGIWIQRKSNLTGFEDFDFQWMLTALFHDIGYPLQIANRIMNDYSVKKLNVVLTNSNVTCRKKFVAPANFQSLIELTSVQKQHNSLKFIGANLKKCDIEIDPVIVYERMVETGNVDHGVVSSLMLLSYIDILYQKNNPERKKYKSIGNIEWGQKAFIDYVVPTCSAIFLHCLKKNVNPSLVIKKDKAPLAWLLRLADSLQDWGRACGPFSLGNSPTRYRIGYNAESETINFVCPTSKTDKSIINDLSVLDNPDVVKVQVRRLQGE